jgi:hypothetical protein
VTESDIAASAAPTLTPGNGERFAAAPLAGGGTSVRDWLSASPLPELDLDECPGLVVVAPHPDDETLGLGATMAQLAARGVDVTVVSVTDGGAAYPGLSPADQTRLEVTRRNELRLATRLLGVPEPISLGLPDGQLCAYEDELTAVVTEILRRAPGAVTGTRTMRRSGGPPRRRRRP